jgi:hypothetical protein
VGEAALRGLTDEPAETGWGLVRDTINNKSTGATQLLPRSCRCRAWTPRSPCRSPRSAASGLVVEVLQVLDGYVAVIAYWAGEPVAIYDEPAGEA